MSRGSGRRAPFRAQLLPPDGQDRQEDGEGAVDGLFPAIDQDELWEGFFQLLYRQHGGSGLSLSLEDVMDLDLDRIRWLLERLGEQRDKEARELAAAARRGRR
ncbi:MAG: hypothetical protein E6J91_18755 [Deltaproteobacteria bacterium]|nr:MAG: hypothetical protein E6J91_18755 [Deltaproteobacteria bacterium]